LIVVDTNVLCYLALPGESSELAHRLYARDPQWCAPLLWIAELRNVLAGQVRRKSVTLETAVVIALRLETVMRGREFKVRSDDVLSLASRSGCTAYDCEFVALAKELRVALVTSDKQVLTAFPDVARSLATA